MPHINRWHLLSDISHLMKTLHSVLPPRRWGNKIIHPWQDYFLNFWLVGEEQMGRGVTIWSFLNSCKWQQLKKGTWFVLFAIFIKGYSSTWLFCWNTQKVVLNLHCRSLLMLSEFNWNEVSWIILSSGENESIFVIFVCIILVLNTENR